MEENTPEVGRVVLALDAPRIVKFKDRGYTYIYQFERIAQEDWLHYFAGIVLTRKNDNGTMVTVFDADTAGIELVKEKVTRVTGYPSTFTETHGWPTKLPYRHTSLVFGMLRDVTLDRSVQGPMNPLAIEVRLKCRWGTLQSGMNEYSGLIHRFDPPTAEQIRKYNRAVSETRVVGGDRKGQTIYTPRQPLLVKMYDELIASVDGYAVNGQLLSSVEQIRREMDACHKVVAVQQLFDTSEDEPEQQQLGEKEELAEVA